MPTDEERLVVSLEARINQFEKNMAKAERSGTQSFQGLRRSSKTATQQMEQDAIRSSTRINQAFATVGTKIGGFGKAFGGGLIGTVAGLGIVGIIGGLQDVAKGVAEVGDEAKRAGVGAKAFQELKFVAEQNRIGVDALTDGLKEMNLRADEFILTGQGSSAEAFQRLGFNAETLAQKLKDPSALFTEIIGKLGQLDKAAQIRIADEIFGGTGGEKFVQLIYQGEAGIRETIKAANDLGIVMDEQLIERAAEVDRQFHKITTTVGSNLKSAIVSAAEALSNFMQMFGQMEARTKTSLENALATSRMNLSAAEKRKAEMPGFMSAPFDKQIEKSRAEIARVEAELKRRAFDEATVKLLSQKNQMQGIEIAKGGRLPATGAEKKTGGSGSRSSSISETERERKAVADLIAELEEELRLVNSTDAERRKSEASRQAGAAATDLEREKIIGLTEAIYQEEEARQRQVDAMEYGRDLTRGAIDDLTAGLENNKGLWESLGDAGVNALKRIADTMIDDVLDSIFKVNNAAGSSGGGILSLLFSGVGSLFGGGKSAAPGFLDNGFDTSFPSFDGGGGTGMGPRSGGLDGKGGFMALLHPRETVTDHTKAGGTNQNGSQPVNVTFAPVYNVQGYGQDIESLKAQMQRDQADFKAKVVNTVREAKSSRVKGL